MKQTEAFRLLASADRQLVLHELVEKGGETTIGRLSREVAARRHRISPERISDDEIERAYVRLVHTHLPVMAEKGVISVEWDGGDVFLTDEEDIDHLFEAAEELDSWPPDDLLEHPSRSS